MNAPKKSAKPVPANPGRVYAAAMELTTAISTFEEFGIPFPLMPLADASVRAAKNEEAALGTCFEEIRRLADELWGEWPESTEKEKWAQIGKILALKNWPDADWIIDQAREAVPDPEAELEAVPVLLSREERDAKADKLAAICQELGLEHATTCYEESDGVRPHGQTFWVCKPGCATLRAHAILREREGAAP